MKTHLLRLFAYFAFLAFSLSTTNAQKVNIDSIQTLANKENNPEKKAKLINELGFELIKKDKKLSKEYLNEALNIAIEIGCIQEMAYSNHYLGYIAYVERNYDEAQNKLEKAIDLYTRIEDDKNIGSIKCKLGLTKIKNNNWDAGLILMNDGFELLKKTNQNKELATNYNKISTCYNKKPDFDTSRFFLNKALKIFETINDKSSQSIILNNIGNTFIYQHNYVNALDCYQKSIKIAESINNYKALSLSTNGIGNVYYYMGKYPEALEYFIMAKTNYEVLNNNEGVASSNINIGSIYQSLEKPDEAIEYFIAALNVYEKNDMITNMSIVLSNIGVIFESKKDFKKAKHYYQRALDIDIQQNNFPGLCYSFYNLATVNENLNNIVKAEELYLKCATNASKVNEIHVLKECYLSLTNLYENQNRSDSALSYFKQYTEIKDSIWGIEKTKQLDQLQTKFETERKEKEIILLKEKEIIQERELRKRQIIAISVTIIAILLFVLTMFISRAFLMKRKHHKILNLKNKLILQQKESIATEKRKADSWIIDYLPNEKADEIKKTGVATEKHYEILSDVINMLEQEKMQFEMNALQSAVNPHFLYNTLNILTALIAENPEISIEFTNNLAHVYRYMCECNKKEISELAEEIQFMKSYHYLLSFKYGENLKIIWDNKEKYLEYYLPPLTLQLLLENAIKHNVILQNEPLTIEISINGNDYLKVKNNLQPKHNQERSTNIGLSNIQDRYKLLTDKEIKVNNTNEYFEVEVPLIVI